MNTAKALKDMEISNPPSDSISSVSFNKQYDYLAVASWDNSVRVYGINNFGLSSEMAVYHHNASVLSVIWSLDHNKVVSGGADNKGQILDLVTGQVVQVAEHNAPIRVIRWIEIPGSHSSVLATGSWDKTLRYWDFRAPRPAASVVLTERCFAMDTQGQTLIVGTADRQIQLFDINKPTIPAKTMASPLKMQTRTIACFAANPHPGFAIGSVEGRVAMHYFEDQIRDRNYSFRCHRGDTAPGKKDQAKVYAINDIQFHPVHTGTFSTCGSDGVVNYWDRDRRMRFKSFEAAPGSITTSAFNMKGTLFAYAVSYDWSKGHAGMTSGYPNKLMVHKVATAEVKRPVRDGDNSDL